MTTNENNNIAARDAGHKLFRVSGWIGGRNFARYYKTQQGALQDARTRKHPRITTVSMKDYVSAYVPLEFT